MGTRLRPMVVGLFVTATRVHRPSWRCCGSHGSSVRLLASWRVHFLIRRTSNSHQLLLHPAHLCNRTREAWGAHMDRVCQARALFRPTLAPQDECRPLRYRTHAAIPVAVYRCPPTLRRDTFNAGTLHTCSLSAARSFPAATLRRTACIIPLSPSAEVGEMCLNSQALRRPTYTTCALIMERRLRSEPSEGWGGERNSGWIGGSCSFTVMICGITG